MSNRLHVHGISFQRDSQGVWQLSRMATNSGVFGMGESENKKLDKETVDRFCAYIIHELRPDLEAFIEEEQRRIETESEPEDTEQDEQSTPGDSA